MDKTVLEAGPQSSHSEVIMESLPIAHWNGPLSIQTQKSAVEALEGGKIIVLPGLSFRLQAEEVHSLNDMISGQSRKNISWDHHTKKISNVTLEGQGKSKLASMLDRFSSQTFGLLKALLPLYASSLEREGPVSGLARSKAVLIPRAKMTGVCIQTLFPAGLWPAAVSCASSLILPLTAPFVIGRWENLFQVLSKNSPVG